MVDHNALLLERLGAIFAARAAATVERPRVIVVANESARGASGARNTGAVRAAGELIAFLDDDAAAEPGWLAALVAAVAGPGVVGAGGFVAADWAAGRPPWFPGEFAWVVGATYDGAPTRPATVRNGWAENMIVRRDAFAAVGGFRTGFGKLGAHSRPEDTDLCIRMQAGGGTWRFEPAAVVRHHVPAERSTFRFFLRRCWHEGRGKADLGRLLADRDTAGREEAAYVRQVLPRGFARHAGRAVRTGRPEHLSRAAAIAAGLVAAAAGYAWQRVIDLRGAPPLVPHPAAPPERRQPERVGA